MKRWLVAVAVLLGGAVSVSQAEYVLIRKVLGGRQGDPHPPPGTRPGQPGTAGQPPGPGPGIPPPGRGGPGEDIPPLAPGQTMELQTAALAVQAVVPLIIKRD